MIAMLSSVHSLSKRLAKKNFKGKDKSNYALNWLQYGFLEKGEVVSITIILQGMKNYAAETSTKVARSYLVAMQGAFVFIFQALRGIESTFFLE
ncbi:MAG: hypothetical protein ACI8YQ_004958 [Polaribacter sp.]|jgi:hypothetical protein